MAIKDNEDEKRAEALASFDNVILAKKSILLFSKAKSTQDPEKAVELYSDAIDFEKAQDSPDKNLISEIYQWRGELYLKLQVAILSSSDFLHSLEYNPNNAISHNNLGIWFTMPQFTNPDLEKALEHLNEAVRLAPERLDFKMNRAVIRIQTGDRKGGKKELEELYDKGFSDAKIAMDRFL